VSRTIFLGFETVSVLSLLTLVWLIVIVLASCYWSSPGAAQKRCDKFPSLLPQDVSWRSQADQKEAA
jgi:lipoprotein